MEELDEKNIAKIASLFMSIFYKMIPRSLANKKLISGN